MKDLRDLLEVGRVVETRDGDMGFVLKDRIICKDGWYTLIRFDEELKHEFDENGDIVVVYDSPIIVDTAWNFESENKILLRPVWRRKEFKVTEDEKTILKNIDDAYNYIARDADGNLCVYKFKPNKVVSQGVWGMSSVGLCTEIIVYKHLFNYIKWEDEEPTLIKDLLK